MQLTVSWFFLKFTTVSSLCGWTTQFTLCQLLPSSSSSLPCSGTPKLGREELLTHFSCLLFILFGSCTLPTRQATGCTRSLPSWILQAELFSLLSLLECSPFAILLDIFSITWDGARLAKGSKDRKRSLSKFKIYTSKMVVSLGFLFGSHPCLLNENFPSTDRLVFKALQ